MNEEEKIFQGKMFNAREKELRDIKHKTHLLCKKYNSMDEYDTDRLPIIKDFIGSIGDKYYFQGPIQFYGECKIAECNKKRQIRFCGECGDFPCDTLVQYSNDEEHGDNPKGARIERCKSLKLALVKEAREGIEPVGYCGHHSNENEYLAKATALFIKEYGLECYKSTLKKAIDSNVNYPKDFDAEGSVEKALELLKKYM